MNRILAAALALCAPIAAYAAPVSCMPHAPEGRAPQWAVDLVKQRGGITASRQAQARAFG
jgi:hypothetical protein